MGQVDNDYDNNVTPLLTKLTFTNKDAKLFRLKFEQIINERNVLSNNKQDSVNFLINCIIVLNKDV